MVHRTLVLGIGSGGQAIIDHCIVLPPWCGGVLCVVCCLLCGCCLDGSVRYQMLQYCRCMIEGARWHHQHHQAGWRHRHRLGVVVARSGDQPCASSVTYDNIVPARSVQNSERWKATTLATPIKNCLHDVGGLWEKIFSNH